MIVRLGLGGLRRTPLRVTLTSLGVAIATGALVSMVGFALGVQKQAETPFQMLDLLNNIEVRAKDAEDSEETEDPDAARDSNDAEDANDVGEAPVLDDAALEKMEEIPGVALAYPDFRVRGIDVTLGDKTEKAMAVGFPREAALVGFAPDILVAGDFFTAGGGPEAILSDGLAKELGFATPRKAIGETVILEASGLSSEQEATFRFHEKQFSVKVVGVYRLPGMGPRFASRSILLPVELMKEIPGIQFESALDNLRAGRTEVAPGYQRVTVRVEHPSDLAPVEREIEKMGFKCRTMVSHLEEIRAFFVFIDVLLASVGTVALVVAGLGIVNTLLMSVLERYQEIGIYKTVGASDGDLAVLFLTEAGLIGLLGGLGGLALGRVASWLLELIVNAYARSEEVTVHLEIFAFPLWLFLGALAFAVAISVIAGVYPALRAARIDPIRALRSS